jgi:hypothetical protein
MKTAALIHRTKFFARRRRFAEVLGLACVLMFVGLWFFGDDVSETQKYLATAVGVLSLLPFFLFLFDRHPPQVPLMAMNTLFYLVAYSIPGFMVMEEEIIQLRTTSNSWISGLTLALVGVPVQTAAYYLTKPWVVPVQPFRLAEGMTVNDLRLMAWSLAVFRFALLVIPDGMNIPTISQFAKLSPYITMSILYSLALLGRLGRSEKTLFYFVYIPIELGLRLSTGAVYEPVQLVMVLFLIRWVVEQKVNWGLIAAGILIFAVLNPVKHQYREAVRRAPNSNALSAADKAELFLGMTANFWLGGGSQSVDVSTNLLNRLNHLAIAAVVTDASPNRVPYWNGDTLSLGVYTFIPRILWPGKPGMSVGNEFGKRYLLLDMSNDDTTVNLTWLNEFYCNFGYWGVVVGMACLGSGFALLERWYANPKSSKVNVSLSLSIIFPLLYPESNLALMGGSVLTCTLAVYVLTQLISNRRR